METVELNLHGKNEKCNEKKILNVNLKNTLIWSSYFFMAPSSDEFHLFIQSLGCSNYLLPEIIHHFIN